MSAAEAQALVAATMMYELLCVMVEAVAAS
jgi:hypothetical protein